MEIEITFKNRIKELENEIELAESGKKKISPKELKDMKMLLEVLRGYFKKIEVSNPKWA